MNVAQTKSVLKKPAALKIALATIFPLVVVILAPETLLFGTQYGIDGGFVLLGSCVVLLGSAAWLNQVMFRGREAVLPFVAAIFSILSVWM